MTNARPRAAVIQGASADPRIVVRAWQHAANLRTAIPDVVIEIVIQGAAVAGLVAGTDTAQLLARKRADFPDIRVFACQNALRANNVEIDSLADGVETVPAGIAHIVSRQWDGWAYSVTA